MAKNDTLVVIVTNYGIIKIKLYEDTPKHRNNFIKLAKNGFYDSLLFHRIINGFMIQGGDPLSKNATPDRILGNGDIGYTIPPEITRSHFHKKGALAAARQGDDVNPEKVSSGCQFYIVQGKKYSELDMITVESRMANQAKQSLIWKFLGKSENKRLKDRYIMHQQARNNDSLSAINSHITQIIEPELKNQKNYKFTADEKLVYSNIGGAPHLDGNYTIFGEVIEGIEVLDKIAEVEVVGNNRPKSDIIMRISLEILN
jgi:cyclophilin family peptidyl-prolyl cis-trans isomerase